MVTPPVFPGAYTRRPARYEPPFPIQSQSRASGAVDQMAFQGGMAYPLLRLTDGIQIVLAGSAVDFTVQQENLPAPMADVGDGMAALPGG